MSNDRPYTGAETLPRVAAVSSNYTHTARPYLRLVYSEAATPNGVRVGDLFEVADQPLVIGRAPGSVDDARAIGVDTDGWMSRRHARVEATVPPQVNGVMIHDLESRNGTFVQGNRISRKTNARVGEVVQIGSCLFVVGVLDEDDDEGPPPPRDFICASSVMRAAWQRVLRLADSGSSVLLLGEMGTGKTRIAQLIHDQSDRSGPFVPHNCSAIPINLEEATLFGIVGGFIPTVKAQDGLLTRAKGGTLFLDELADMPPLAQAKLLDAFDSRKPSYMPVGGTKRMVTDCRLISATNRDVFQLASNGQLRHDLLSRLVVGQLTVPPLRERREDLLPMFSGALERAGVTDLGATIPNAEVAAALLLAHWVENVRGLETLAHRVALGEVLTPELVSAHADRGLAQTPAPQKSRPVAHATINEYRETPLPVVQVWPPAPRELLGLLAKHNFSVKNAAADIGRRRETLSRLIKSTFGKGGKIAAQHAYRIWKASGRAPSNAAEVLALHPIFQEKSTPETHEAREAWSERGELL